MIFVQSATCLCMTSCTAALDARGKGGETPLVPFMTCNVLWKRILTLIYSQHAFPKIIDGD